jgi:hypothetical protein
MSGRLSSVIVLSSLLLASGSRISGMTGDTPLVIEAKTYRVRVDPKGFRLQIERPDKQVIAPAHAISGLQLVAADGRGGGVVAAEVAKV